MREIRLTQGRVAFVDNIDYEWLNRFKWHATKYRGKYWYAEGLINCGGIKKKLYMHRILLQTPRGMETDHMNGNGLDNRRENIRVCTTAQNQHNQIVKRQGITSKLKGVYWNKGSKKWKSQIQVNGIKISLGYFASEVEAAIAYDLAAEKYFGRFKKTNRELALIR